MEPVMASFGVFKGFFYKSNCLVYDFLVFHTLPDICCNGAFYNGHQALRIMVFHGDRFMGLTLNMNTKSQWEAPIFEDFPGVIDAYRHNQGFRHLFEQQLETLNRKFLRFARATA